MTNSNGPLSIIGVAVTPVVMISANAILTSAMNARHSSVADRLRNLLAEYRRTETGPERRDSIAAQVPLFQKRIARLESANLMLFLATACFVGTVIVISLSSFSPAVANAALPIFLAGVVLMLSGVLSEVLELRHARETMRREVASTIHTHSTQKNQQLT